MYLTSFDPSSLPSFPSFLHTTFSIPPSLPPSSPPSEWYESDALLLSEDGQVLSGLLMGLNAIDYNMLMKGEEFDKSVSSEHIM